jgi:hypothetical protein
MSENERQQRLIERVQEDERLRGDLTDEAATALVEWASRHVADAAADPARPDAEVEADVQAIRAAARAAARAGEDDPPHVIAIAEATLKQHAEAAGPTQARADTAGAGATAALPAAEQTQPPTAQPDVTPTQQGAGSAQADAVGASATAALLAVEQTRPPTAQPDAADPPKRRRISFWRRWSPFANIWNRFRGDR